MDGTGKGGAMIEIAGLEVVFASRGDRVRAVDGIELAVAEREAFGLVGESGSGKSTVLRALCGLAPVSGGRATIAGLPPPRRRDPAFARRVQMVFQDPFSSLHPRHTIDRTLAEPLVIHRLGDRRERDRQVEAALTDVGLDPGFRFRYPHQLSGGQRQRVAVARALMLEPQVLLLDEPTSALDASVQAEVLNLLSRLRRERGLTFLMVSHDFAVIDHMCDRVAVMQGGRIVETLDHAALARRQVREDYTRRLLEASSAHAPLALQEEGGA